MATNHAPDASSQETPCCATECHRPHKPWSRGQKISYVLLLLAVMGIAGAAYVWSTSLRHEEAMAQALHPRPEWSAAATANIAIASGIFWCGVVASLLVWLIGTTVRTRLSGPIAAECACGRTTSKRFGPVAVTRST